MDEGEAAGAGSCRGRRVRLPAVVRETAGGAARGRARAGVGRRAAGLASEGDRGGAVEEGQAAGAGRCRGRCGEMSALLQRISFRDVAGDVGEEGIAGEFHRRKKRTAVSAENFGMYQSFQYCENIVVLGKL